MKKTLEEELRRIHTITYGKEVINEGFIDNLLNKIGIGRGEKKVKDPKKADLVTTNVDEFFNTIENEIKSNGLSQQELGSMTYQKGVESMQIGLILLGYELPKFGVDGLFGPETSEAVNKFKQDKSISIDPQSKITVATPEMLTKLLELLKTRGVKPEEIDSYINSTPNGNNSSNLDLSTSEGYTIYSDICQKFIDIHGPNLLGITGTMLGNGAKLVYEKYGKYVPPELALSQLILEGGIQNKNINSRPIKTKNPFNVGNIDSGKDTYHDDVQSGINDYYELIAKNYLGKGKTVNDLMSNFVNTHGSRYATDTEYEQKLNSYATQVNKISRPIMSKLGKTDTSTTS